MTLSASNSYVSSLAEADTVFDSIFTVRAWPDATTVQKEKALIEATSRIDRLNFRGEKSSASQALQFPRRNDTSIPADIQKATCLVADMLLDGFDPEHEYNLLRVKTSKFDAITETANENVPEHIVAGIPSIEAWRYLRPYLRGPQTVRIDRLS